MGKFVLMSVVVVHRGATRGRGKRSFRKRTIAHDNGKPVARQGRKAVSLRAVGNPVPGRAEIVWLPKAVGENFQLKRPPCPRAPGGAGACLNALPVGERPQAPTGVVSLEPLAGASPQSVVSQAGRSPKNPFRLQTESERPNERTGRPAVVSAKAGRAPQAVRRKTAPPSPRRARPNRHRLKAPSQRCESAKPGVSAAPEIVRLPKWGFIKWVSFVSSSFDVNGLPVSQTPSHATQYSPRSSHSSSPAAPRPRARPR